MTTPYRPVFPAGFVTRYTTDDFDDMARRMPAWEHDYRKIQPGRFQGQLSLAHTSHLQSSDQYFNCGMAISSRLPQDCWSFVLPVEGREYSRVRGLAVVADRLCVAQAGEALDWVATGPLRWLILSVEAARLEAHLGTCGCEYLSTRTVDGQLALDDGGDMQLALRWRELNKRVMSRPDLLSDPAQAHRIEHAFLETIAACAVSQSPRPRLSQRTQVARSARDYLHAQRHRPVSIQELCKALGVPERTLHLAFHEAYGMPPRHYMKLQRLNGARQALLKADGVLTVSRIAMDWGFLHLGRFAVDYHALFGEPPSESLGRRKDGRAYPELNITDAPGPARRVTASA